MKNSEGGRSLGPEEAAVFEASVVPHYLSLFGEQLVGMIVPGRDARVVHLQCRTGYPDRLLLDPLPNVHVYGCDDSEPALDLARTKARSLSGLTSDYRLVSGTTTPFPAGAFSHGFTLHPAAALPERQALLEELARIVAPRGQALVAMPLRGSFAELADLLREYALKYERTDLTSALETATQLRPSEEGFRREFETAGFEHVEVDVRKRTLKFGSGRELFEDAACRLLVVPELRATLPITDDTPFDYVRDAIDKYWSDGTFELTVEVGVVSGRRKA